MSLSSSISSAEVSRNSIAIPNSLASSATLFVMLRKQPTSVIEQGKSISLRAFPPLVAFLAGLPFLSLPPFFSPAVSDNEHVRLVGCGSTLLRASSTTVHSSSKPVSASNVTMRVSTSVSTASAESFSSSMSSGSFSRSTSSSSASLRPSTLKSSSAKLSRAMLLGRSRIERTRTSAS